MGDFPIRPTTICNINLNQLHSESMYSLNRLQPSLSPVACSNIFRAKNGLKSHKFQKLSWGIMPPYPLAPDCIGDFMIDVRRNFDKMQVIFKAITGNSGYTFWGGKRVRHCTGERKICRKNHGASHCLGKFSLLGNVRHLSVPQ